MKRIMPLVISLVLALLILAGCGGEAAVDAPPDGASAQPVAGAPDASAISAEGMTEGYIPSELVIPDEVGGAYDMTLYDNKLIIQGRPKGGVAVGYLDLATGEWTVLPLNFTGSSDFWGVASMSAADGYVWLLIGDWMREDKDVYTLARCPLEPGGVFEMCPLGFQAAVGTESASARFSGMVALTADRALLYDAGSYYVTDVSGQLISKHENSGTYFLGCAKNNGERAVMRDEGYVYFDPASVATGDVVADIPEGQWTNVISENGHWLGTGITALELYSGGETTELFQWLDVALDADTAVPQAVVESAAGDFYCQTYNAKIVKVSPGLVKIKKELSLYAYGGSLAMRNAIIRFNNTDPEYKVVLESYDQFREGDLERFALEVATGAAPDIVCTSALPDAAVDGGAFIDLLPYLDADPDISREDFFPSLLEGMLRDGGLYELTPRMSIMTFAVDDDLYGGRESWTIERVNELIAERPEGMPVYFWHRDRSVILNILCIMSTAEYVDWDAGVCDFNCEGFMNWLRFVKETPYAAEYADTAVLLVPMTEVNGLTPYMNRNFLREGYAYCGLPGTGGNGSYFLEPGEDSFAGAAASFGIMASCEDKDGAWRFLRTMLLTSGDTIEYDLPVLKKSFDKALENSITEKNDEGYGFWAEDAEKLRELVYGTEKLARRDGALSAIITEEANRYFTGQLSLEDAAAMIQSRAAIYVAEQN